MLETALVTDVPTHLIQPYHPESAKDFYEKSLSPHTRKAYLRVLREFFQVVKGIAPTAVTPRHVLAWRELLIQRRQKPNTIAFKLSVLRSFFAYLLAGGLVNLNPAASQLVPPPPVPEEQAGRALTMKEARLLLAAPDKNTVAGARDYALMVTMLRLSLRVSEVCVLRGSSLKWSHGRWVVKFTGKGSRERTLPLPDEVRLAMKAYLGLDQARRKNQHCDGEDAWLFQPLVNYRTLEFNKPLTTRMVNQLVKKWGAYCGLGSLSPHDLRRTAITRALDQGLSYRQVQMMSGHKDPKTVMRYDHGRENLELNAVNFLDYEG